MKQLFKKSLINRTVFFVCLFILIGKIPFAAEDNFLASNCASSFPEAMLRLQDIIKNKGYMISRVQHVDKGLRSRGYETEIFRVVFFGKTKEIQLIRKRYPALIPYIPLNITIFEEATQTGISTIDPVFLLKLYKSDEIKQLIETWHKDMVDIFDEYQHCTS